MDRYEQIKDELLVMKCQTGEVQAFEELVDRWQKRLWRHARVVIGDEDAAWDAVQETWVAIVKGIAKLQDAGAFPAWAYRILTSKCSDIIRMRQRQRRMDEDFVAEASSAGNPRPDEAHDALRSAISRLPEEQRVLLSLHYAEGYTTTEIAEIMGVAQGTVKAKLFHARDHLRRLIGTG